MYLVEGYFDVIAMHQAGITNTVAPLGIAFTVEHAKILRRFTGTIVLVFDNDEAGRRAALRAATICENQRFQSIRIVELPKKDIADILKDYGESGVRDEILEDRDFFDYYINMLLSVKSGSQEEREKALLEISTYIAGIAIGYRKEMYISKVTQLFGITKAVLQRIIKYIPIQNQEEEYTDGESKYEKGVQQRKSRRNIQKTAELLFVVALSYNLTNYTVIRREVEVDDLLDPHAKHVYLKMEELYRANTLNFTDLMEHIDEDIAITIRELFFSGDEISKYANVLVTEFIDKHKILKYRHRSNEINRLLAVKEQLLAQNNTSSDINPLLIRREIKDLLEEKKHISTMLIHLQNNKGSYDNGDVPIHFSG